MTHDFIVRLVRQYPHLPVNHGEVIAAHPFESTIFADGYLIRKRVYAITFEDGYQRLFHDGKDGINPVTWSTKPEPVF